MNPANNGIKLNQNTNTKLDNFGISDRRKPMKEASDSKKIEHNIILIATLKRAKPPEFLIIFQ